MSAPTEPMFLVDVREAIITKQLTRERCCDGKSRFNRYDKAERSIRKWAEREPTKQLVAYACPFCMGFHLATKPRSRA